MKKLIKNNILKIRSYEPGKPIEALRRELGLIGDICKLASNENPLGMSPLARRAIGEEIEQGHLYPDDSCSELREKLGGLLEFPPANIRVGNGSSELIYLLGVALLEKGDNVVMSEGSFNMAKLVTEIAGCRAKEVPLDAFHHDLEGILASIDRRTKIVYLDLPMNPVGTGLTQEQLDRFVADFPEDVLLICDEAYYQYADAEDRPDSLPYVRQGCNVLVLRTFSKIYGMAGLRVGFGVGQKDMIEALRKACLPFAVNRLAQVGAMAALEDHQHIQKTLDIIRVEKAFLYDRFDELEVFYIPSKTNFVTIDVKKDCRDFCAEAEKKALIIRPLSSYGMPTFVRVTIGTPEQNRRFIEVLKDLYRPEAGR